MKYRVLQLITLCLSASAAVAADDCARGFAQAAPSFFSRAELAEINELRAEATSKEFSRAERREALEDLLTITQERLKQLGFKTRRRAFANDEVEGKQEMLLQILEAPDNLPIGRVINRVKEKFGLRVAVDPILLKSEMNTEAYFMEQGNITVLDVLNFRELGQVNQDFLHEVRHRYYLELIKRGIADPHHGFVTVVAKGFHLERKGGNYDQFLSFEELSTYFRDTMVSLGEYKRGAGSKTSLKKNLLALRRLSRAIARTIERVDWAVDPALVDIDYPAKFVTYPLYVEGKLVAQFGHSMPQISKGMSREEILSQLRRDFTQIREIAQKRITFAQQELAKLK